MKKVHKKMLLVSTLFVALCLVASSVFFFLRERHVHHEQYGVMREEAEVPGSISRQTWIWEGEGDSGARAVPVAGGVLIILAHSVTALDGETGSEAWKFAVDAPEMNVQVSPNLEFTHVSYSRSEVGHVVVLNNRTGDIVESREFSLVQFSGFDDSISDAGILVDSGHVNLVEGEKNEHYYLSFLPFEGKEATTFTESFLACDESAPKDIDSVSFPDALVFFYTCNAPEGGVHIKGFASNGEKLLWHANSQDFELIDLGTSIRRVGDFLAVSEKIENWSGQGGKEFVENLIMEPTSGSLISESSDLEEGESLVKTFAEGYLVESLIRGDETLVRYEHRDFDGQVVASVEEPIERVLDRMNYLLPLKEDLVKMEAFQAISDTIRDGKSSLLSMPWSEAAETTVIELDNFVGRAVHDVTPEIANGKLGDERFMAAPGAVVMFDLGFESREEGNIRFIGFN